MDISSIFSARNATLLVFILVVLFLGAAFDVQVGPRAESFADSMKSPSTSTQKKQELPLM
jgi:hypothetical protein